MALNIRNPETERLAEALAKLLRRTDIHINVIPLNPTPGSKWTASDPADEREFVRRLEARGIPTTVFDATIRSNPLERDALGGILILVPAGEAEQAEDILERQL